jgi:hypothetical protein
MASKRGEPKWIDRRLHLLEVLGRHPTLLLVQFMTLFCVLSVVPKRWGIPDTQSIALFIGAIIIYSLTRELINVWDRLEKLEGDTGRPLGKSIETAGESCRPVSAPDLFSR